MTKRTLFVLAAILLVAAGLYSQSRSARQAAALVNRVTTEDAVGTDATASIGDLNAYVKSHMGASVSYSLTGSYNRALASANTAATAQASTGQIYAAAQAACSGKSNSIVQAQCNQAYISSRIVHLPLQTPVPAPKLSDYHHSLSSPLWTSDLTGALFLGAFVALIMGVSSRSRRRR